MTEPLDALAGMRGAWMAGRSAAPLAPTGWIAGDEPGLAALAGQAFQVLTRPAVPPDLASRPPLPRLAAPLLPEALRPHVRRLLAAQRKQPGAEQGLIRLLAARGYAAHPADWMPEPNDDWAPEAYAPWVAWAEAGRGEAATAGADVLTAETYDDWPWAERRAALSKLRRHHPAAARHIIAAKAASEPAERRLKLIEILAERLEGADAPVLEPLREDRSDRVASLVRRLLARLGRAEGDPALARELAAMVTLASRGFIRRRTQLTVGALKTRAQERRRAELFRAVPFADLAAALGVQPAAIVENAPDGDATHLMPFLQCVVESAPDEARRALMSVMLDDDDTPLALTSLLATRASPEERRATLGKALARETAVPFSSALAYAGPVLGGVPYEALTAAEAWRSLLREEAHAAAATGFFNVALLLSPDAAATATDAAIAAGLSAADPRLDALRLSAALAPSGAPVP